MVKDRPDCWEKQVGLSDEQKQLVYETIRDYGVPKARALLSREELMDGIAIPGKAALYAFFERYFAAVSEDRLFRAVTASENLDKVSRKIGISDDKVVKALQVMTIEALSTGDPAKTAEALDNYNGLLYRITKQQETALKRDQWETDVAKKALEYVNELRVLSQDSALTQHERVSRAREQLFGTRPESGVQK